MAKARLPCCSATTHWDPRCTTVGDSVDGVLVLVAAAEGREAEDKGEGGDDGDEDSGRPCLLRSCWTCRDSSEGAWDCCCGCDGR